MNEYFTNYEDLSVHELMLRDAPRQEAYRNAIFRNAQLIHDKIVIDVGAGTGILSILCAKAGAKKVFAVEATNLAGICKKIVVENRVEDVVEVYHGEVENFILPEGIKAVDVIISEWMGFYLLHEGMLDSVIFARDKFLKPEGIMIPHSATIYLAPCAVSSRYSDWDDVVGIKMKSFAEEFRLQKSQHPEILNIPEKDILAKETAIVWLDLKDVSLEDLQQFSFQDIIVIKKSARFQGISLWFTCQMVENSDIMLSTGPLDPATHWKQTVIVLPENACKDVEDGEPVVLNLLIKRNEDSSRRYDLQLTMLDANEVEHMIPCECYHTKCILAKAYCKTIGDEMDE